MTNERTFWLVRDARKAKREGLAGLHRRQRRRLADMVAFARSHSAYYRELYRDLPAEVEDPIQLPTTSKKQLMPRFDDWVTDRQVTSKNTRAFVEDPALVGERFHGKYTVATTSGTTGTPGVFLMDERSMRVTAALALRMLAAWLGFADVLGIAAAGGRLSMVNAMGGHFASAVAAARLQRRRGRRYQVLPVRMPLPQMTEQLDRFRPTILAPYASMGALLANEQEAGRLHIAPVLVVLSAEGLPLSEHDRIAAAFGAKVRDSYAATECPFISYRCQKGWLHVNADWLMLEPVDGEHRATPPGQPSHTVLLSNLANRVQPILRYDLGDSVLQRPDACECGDPLPAIQVHGRTADVLTFSSDSGDPRMIAPLAIVTALDKVRGLDRFQLVQTSPKMLRLRLRAAPGADPQQAWQAAHDELTGLLAEHGLPHVSLERAAEEPEMSSGGKHRPVIPLTDGAGEGTPSLGQGDVLFARRARD